MPKDENVVDRIWILHIARLGAVLLLISLLLASICYMSVAQEPTVIPDAHQAQIEDPTREISASEITDTLALTSSSSLTFTNVSTLTASPSLTPTHTLTPTSSPSPTPTYTLTPTSSPSPTPTRTSTPTPSPSPTPTHTPTPTSSPSPTPTTPTPTFTPVPPPPESTGELYLYMIAILGAIVVAATVLLIVLLKKRIPGPPLPLRPVTEPPLPAPTSPSPDQPYLQSTADPQLWFPLEQRMVRIGRGKINHLIIGRRYPGWETVSQIHALFIWDERRQHWLVVDQNSVNGVFVQGQRTGENVLQDGDLVRLGHVEFIFHVPERGE